METEKQHYVASVFSLQMLGTNNSCFIKVPDIFLVILYTIG